MTQLQGSDYTDFTNTTEEPELHGSTAEDFIDVEPEPGVHDPDFIADLRNDAEYCYKCNTELSISKNGKKYCYARCWMNCIECGKVKENQRWNRCRSCNNDYNGRTKASVCGYDDGIDQDSLGNPREH